MKHDVLIVGGGLVGNAIAHALAPLGLDIGIVEAFTPNTQQHDDFDVRSFAISYGSQQLLQSWGLWAPLAAHATPMETITVSEKGRFGQAHLTAKEISLPALGYVVAVTRLYEALIQSVQSQKNITRYCPAKVVRATPCESGWQVFLADKTAPLSADLVIAADGARSLLRETAGIAVSVKDYQQTAISASVQLSRDHQNTAYERFTSQGPCALLPTQRHCAGLIWTFPPGQQDAMMALSDQDFLKKLQKQFGYSAGRFVRVGKRQCYPLKRSVVSVPYRPGLLVMGNAAHSLHPISGQGLNLSLRDVVALKTTCQNALAQQQSLGDASTLASYHERVQVDQQAMMRYIDQLEAVFTADIFGLPFARQAGLIGMQSVPPLKRWLTQFNLGIHHKA